MYFDPRSDQERATTAAPERKRIRPRLTCPGHVWGPWMRDVISIKIPGGRIFEMAPDGYFRRFCRVCKGEQKGRGTVNGFRMEVTE